MSWLKYALAGSLAGGLGAAIWAALAYYANVEIGWIAWGIGFLVGLAVRAGAGEKNEGALPGLTAAALAILSVLVGKYAAVSIAVAAISVDFQVEDKVMIIGMADRIIEQREAAGQKVQFPPGQSIETAEEPEHYPPGVWQEAEKQWYALPEEQRDQQKQERQEELDEAIGQVGNAIRREGFFASFSFFDLLWFFLATGTAFKLGSGSIGE